MITILFHNFLFSKKKKWRGRVREEKTEKYGFINQHHRAGWGARSQYNLSVISILA